MFSLFIFTALFFASWANECESRAQSASLVSEDDIRAVNIPCKCTYPVCDCCVKFSIGQLVKANVGCAEVTFEEENVGVKLAVQVGGKTLLEREITLANPPPACVPLPMAPFVEFCATPYNVKVNQEGLNVCVKLSVQILGKDAVALDLHCLRIADGHISVLQPARK